MAHKKRITAFHGLKSLGEILQALSEKRVEAIEHEARHDAVWVVIVDCIARVITDENISHGAKEGGFGLQTEEKSQNLQE